MIHQLNIRPNMGFWTPDQGRIFDSEYALDTEIELIDKERPYLIPRCVIVGVCNGEKAFLLKPEHLAEFFRLHENLTVIMHNAAFDLAVMAQAIGSDYDIYGLVDADRVLDTMILHRLYKLATDGNSNAKGSSLTMLFQLKMNGVDGTTDVASNLGNGLLGFKNKSESLLTDLAGIQCDFRAHLHHSSLFLRFRRFLLRFQLVGQSLGRHRAEHHNIVGYFSLLCCPTGTSCFRK